MSLPYIPLYVADYEADTAHLTIEEDGAYNRLLRLCWRTPGCSVPDDPKWIMRKMRVSADDYYRVVEPVIGEFFTRGMGRVFSARLQAEMEKAEASHKARSDAGKAGNAKRWGKSTPSGKPLETNETGDRNATGLRSQPELEPELEKRETKVSPKKRGTRLPDDWFLPKDWGEWATAEGWNEQAIRIEADKFRDYWISKAGKEATKLDWKATWRNWMRNCKTPKIINGGQDDEPSKQKQRFDAFIAGARGTT